MRRGEVQILSVSLLSLNSALPSSDRLDVRGQCVLRVLRHAGSDDLLSGALRLHDPWSGPGPRSL